MEGQSLADYLDETSRAGKIPPSAEIVHLLMPIATALDNAHRRGELHGALKPSVILLDTGHATPSSLGEPTLINFGMYQRLDPRLLPLDDVSYIAPEIAQGYAATSRSDLYSLGIILYELCTGALPFQGETTSDVLMQHIHGTPISPVLINPYIRPALTGVIMRSLARDPAARFSSATALVTAAAKAMNVSTPESMSHSNPRLSVVNPPSVGDINDPNTPTYLSSSPSLSPFSQSASVSPTVPSSDATVPPLPPAARSVTPVLPLMHPGAAPQMQQSVTELPSPAQTSGTYPIVSPSGPTPANPSIMSPSGAMPVITPNVGSPGVQPIFPQSQTTLRTPVSLFAFATKTRKRSLFIALTMLLLAILLLGSVPFFYFILSAHPSPIPPQTTVVRQAFFVSSGLISESSNQGTTDELNISLQDLPNPSPGTRYYGWLVSTYGLNVSALALGDLPVNHGQITKTYIDPQHNNLLASYSRFLITEEDANQAPTNPSLNKSAWRYYSQFSPTPNMADPKQYSVVDHLRHLLSQDPKLKEAGLSGGLSVWLFRNTSKILEAAGSARDTQKGCVGGSAGGCDRGLILRQVARILDYLDGAQYVSKDNIPSDIQQGGQLLIDANVAKVALLESDTVNQEPPGYLTHIGNHLQLLSQISSTTPEQHALANSIYQDLNNVQGWFDAVHADALKVIQMDQNQLVQPDTLTLLNDLFNQANSAFVGHVDPNTNNVKEGVVQIYYHIQALATFDVTPCVMKNGQSSCGENL